ncbi:homodimeric type [Micractinium conductrix]|uniref:dihydroorotase n=1 Tax=Micractinium conductrix TaxID=554055 RepID=A0A2P6V3E4_9CHLO|nr:homodimeric type [Micractinium conductrix]|eukprot:PSC68594.1 homodimeric type [Micractinium conductrix]
MPNLVPPVTTADAAAAYRTRVQAAVPAGHTFTPLMTCYLTDNTPPEEVARAKEAGVVAFKLYPAGATTNSDSGVTDWKKCLPTLRAMAEAGMLLLVHGEVTDPDVDFFDREKVFIETKLKPLLDTLPELKVVMEHITTADAAHFVAAAPANVGASVTPQHMLLNRNALFVGGLRPHAFCLPILKREQHREAVAAAATGGSPKFFLGTDSAPHPKHAKESACGCAGLYSAPVALALYAHAFEQAGALHNLEAFASFNGPDFYGLPRNTDKVTLRRQRWKVPDSYEFGDSVVVPMSSAMRCRAIISPAMATLVVVCLGLLASGAQARSLAQEEGVLSPDPAVGASPEAPAAAPEAAEAAAPDEAPAAASPDPLPVDPAQLDRPWGPIRRSEHKRDAWVGGSTAHPVYADAIDCEVDKRGLKALGYNAKDFRCPIDYSLVPQNCCDWVALESRLPPCVWEPVRRVLATWNATG